MKILYITYPDYIYSSGIVWNQVFTLAHRLRRQDPSLDIRLLCFVPFPEWRRRKEREKQIRARLGNNIELRAIPAFFRRSWILPLFPLFWLAVAPAARWDVRRFKPDLIHARGIPAGLIARLIAGRIPWLLDVRGLFPEEGARLGFWPEGGLAFRRWEKIEAHLIERAAAVNFVSEKMEAHYQKHGAAGKGHLIPSGVDLETFRPDGRGAEGKTPEYRLVYSGSLGWGNLADLQKLFKAVVRVKPGTRIRFLFPKTLGRGPRNRELELGRFFNPEEYRVEEAWPEEVPEKLRRAHAGLLVRDASPLNQAAWPTKCLEYWASGLPVLTNGGVAAIDDLLKKEKLGVVLSLDKAEEDQTRLIGFFAEEKQMRERCRRFAEENLSIEKTAAQYLKLYRKMAREKA